VGSRSVQRIAAEIARCEQAQRFWELAGDLELSGYYRGASEAYSHILFDSPMPAEEIQRFLTAARQQQMLQLAHSYQEAASGTATVGD